MRNCGISRLEDRGFLALLFSTLSRTLGAPRGQGQEQDAPSSLGSQFFHLKNESDGVDVPQPRAVAQPVPARPEDPFVPGLRGTLSCPAPSPGESAEREGRGMSPVPGLCSPSSRAFCGWLRVLTRLRKIRRVGLGRLPFPAKQTEAQRGKRACPRSPNWTLSIDDAVPGMCFANTTSVHPHDHP